MVFQIMSINRRIKMTQSQFIQECAKRTIEPSIALENDALCEALQERDDEAALRILDEQF